MYWFKRYAYPIIACVLIYVTLLSSCEQSGSPNEKPAYFDLKGYFKSEAARLARQNKPVFKTIIHNGVTESKKINVSNWEHELDMFIMADINKPAWKDRYTVQQTANTTVYKAKDEELETRNVIINKDGDRVKWILIYTHTPKNVLYETKAKLSWFPDSAYQILKTQTVKLLGKNTYDISGKLNQ